jgi:predicted permease
MDQWWVYAGAGFAGIMWGAGFIQPTVALAFLAGLWMGVGGDVMKWAVIALIVGYIVGSVVFAKRGQAAGAGV